MTVAAPCDLDTSLRAAEARLSAGAFEAAVEMFTLCLEQDPAEVRASQGRAMAQFQLKRWAMAADDFRRAQALNPEDLESRLGLGMSLTMNHRIYEGIDTLEALVAAHPRYVRGRIQLALLYYRLCVTAKGREQLAQALAERPTLTERRQIEHILREQRALDERRYYRPDFEALRYHKPRLDRRGLFFDGAWTAFIDRLRRGRVSAPKSCEEVPSA